jgi:hypothetical protein
MESLNIILELPLYQRDILISFGETDEQFTINANKINVFEKHDYKIFHLKEIESKRGRYIMLEGGQSVIRLNYMPKFTESDEMGLLQHEIFHASTIILEDLGIRFKKQSEEAFAYLVQYITTEIYKLIQ